MKNQEPCAAGRQIDKIARPAVFISSLFALTGFAALLFSKQLRSAIIFYIEMNIKHRLINELKWNSFFQAIGFCGAVISLSLAFGSLFYKQIKKVVVEKELGLFDYSIFGIITALCFFSFNQGDLIHTIQSSFAYLNGHIFDFYEYNKNIVGGNSYFPSTYIIFALCGIPLKILGLIKETTGAREAINLFAWYKLMTTCFYLGSAYFLYKIMLCVTRGNKTKSKLSAFLFLSCPIGFYSQFIFGQYDILTVFFMMIGLSFLVKNDLLKFSFFLGLAITFKYFALLIFLTALLLKEKKIKNIFFYLLICLAPIIIEAVFYLISPAFRAGVLGFGAVSYFKAFQLQAGWMNFYLVPFGFILICAFSYFTAADTDERLFQYLIFYASLVCFLLFGFSMFHPQWFLFAVPFWVIGTAVNKNYKTFLILDIIMMLVYIGFSVSVWANNVDASVFRLGVLKDFALQIYRDDMPKMAIFFRVLGDTSIMYTVLSALILINAVFKHPQFQAPLSANLEKIQGLLRIRFLLGVSFFIIPAFAVFFAALKTQTLAWSDFVKIELDENSSAPRQNAKDVEMLRQEDGWTTVEGKNAPKITWTFNEALEIPPGPAMPEFQFAVENAARQPLRIFYDYGAGFEHSSSVITEKDGIHRISIEGWQFDTPLKQIRMDLPADSKLRLKNIAIVKPLIVD
jgi:hypothetical protein